MISSTKRHFMLHVVGGAPVAVAPVNLTFSIRGLDELFAAQASIGIFKELSGPRVPRPPEHHTAWSITRQELRDAVIALDGHCAGASHRQTAEVIFGAHEVDQQWSGSGSILKDKIRRTRARGIRLMMGGYRQFLA